MLMMWIEGMTLRSIGRAFHVSQTTVHHAVHDAQRALRRNMTSKNEKADVPKTDVEFCWGGFRRADWRAGR
jgi:hypothetical protein